MAVCGPWVLLITYWVKGPRWAELGQGEPGHFSSIELSLLLYNEKDKPEEGGVLPSISHVDGPLAGGVCCPAGEHSFLTKPTAPLLYTAASAVNSPALTRTLR